MTSGLFRRGRSEGAIRGNVSRGCAFFYCGDHVTLKKGFLRLQRNFWRLSVENRSQIEIRETSKDDFEKNGKISGNHK
jgi:hypothetical protein